MRETIPRNIEILFRKDLGEVTTYIHFIEISTKEFFERYPANTATDHIHIELAKKYGHRRLQSHHLKPEKFNQFIHLSHLAFINSRADAFCDDVLDFSSMLPNSKKLSREAEGDKLRKTLTVIYASRHNDRNLIRKKISKTIVENYAGKVEVAIVDYYRNIRNSEFHGGLDRSTSNFSLKFENMIIESYKHRPNLPENLTTRDVILYSQAWQNIAKNVCSNLVDINPIVEQLCRKYKSKTSKRRNNAITNKLEQDYLQSKEKIDILRVQTNQWLGSL